MTGYTYDELLASGRAGNSEIIYTHILPDGQTVLHFALTRMRKSTQIKLVPVRSVPLSVEVSVRLMEMQQNIDANYLASLIKKDIPNNYDPLLLMAHSDGSSSIIDGMETYIAAVGKGWKTILVRRLPYSVWTQFTVSGVPANPEHFRKLVEQSGNLPNIKH